MKHLFALECGEVDFDWTLTGLRIAFANHCDDTFVVELDGDTVAALTCFILASKRGHFGGHFEGHFDEEVSAADQSKLPF